ncbi:1-phosphofructokinase family hexose kinase [Lacisediminihabitans profunda]|uniref:Hexose kinase n=1 Tax=Lacisediminihabitans profunda TaxID=2594790 RepID=A0A5C8UV07_9MICO|nr:hexose kinase [Lacisediminihabitans profunda]TXN32487.1 hexose kinase [Lacisediminihabitans profunda]
MARIVVVTPNPAIDVTYRVQRQTVGDTHRVLETTRRPGGKGVNVARVLDALGLPAVSVLPLGGASGEWMLAALHDLGLRVASIPLTGETRTTVTVADDEAHPTVFSEPGPIVTQAEWGMLATELRRQLDGASMLIISGSLPQRSDATLVESWVAEGHRAGVPVLVDATGDALLAGARAGAEIVKPNLQELLDTTGATAAEPGIRALLDLGARLVVVSRGVDGITASDRDRDYTVDAIGGVSGSPTGAGDAATAGLAAALIDGRAIGEALRWAAALGASAVLRPVAGEVDLDAFHLFLSKDTHTDGAEA